MAVLSFDLRMAFDGFALEVAHDLPLQGITALFGPSGSGKSTLLRILAGLEAGAQGRIAFDGETWQDRGAGITPLPAHRRGAGFVFQDARLFPHLDVAGNLRFAERRSRTAGSRISLDHVVEALDLRPLLDRHPHALSGGERQRVAIGRTLLARPRLLLMDEPLASLDLRRKVEILPHIEQLPANFGVPIIYVTHAVDEVVRLASGMIVLDKGRKIAAGPVAAILERLDLPSVTGRFEAGVVLTARVTGHDRDFHLTALDLCGQPIVMPLADLPVGSTVRLRVRARDVALAIARPTGLSVRNVLAGTLTELVEQPDSAFAETSIDIGGAALRARITRAAAADLALAVGQPVYALVKSVSFDRRLLAGGESLD